MIVANLATYPPRRARLPKVVGAIAPQVDRLNIVLNCYEAVPEELPRLPGVVPILPPEDLKDTGKFLPDTADQDVVVLIDDDLDYPPDYVAHSREALAALGEGRVLGGYHGTIYVTPKPGPSLRKLRRWWRHGPDTLLDSRRLYKFHEALDAPVVVDQVGTGTAILAGRDMPPFGYMRDSQMFVDVRLARWCFEQGIEIVCLPRPRGWLTEERHDERIYEFTRQNPGHVSREVATFAFSNPRRGLRPEARGAWTARPAAHRTDRPAPDKNRKETEPWSN